MVDIETLDNHPGGVILSIGAVAFTADSLPASGGFYRRIDLASSVLAGFTISTTTLDWWRQQRPEAVQAAFYCPGGVNIDMALFDFSRFVDRDTRLWAKGPDFDCVLLATAYEKRGIPCPFSFRNTRDVRTILALSGVTQSHNAAKHDALADARNQAEAVMKAWAVLGVDGDEEEGQ